MMDEVSEKWKVKMSVEVNMQAFATNDTPI